MTSTEGVRVAMDPFGEIGYPLLSDLQLPRPEPINMEEVEQVQASSRSTHAKSPRSQRVFQ